MNDNKKMKGKKGKKTTKKKKTSDFEWSGQPRVLLSVYCHGFFSIQMRAKLKITRAP